MALRFLNQRSEIQQLIESEFIIQLWYMQTLEDICQTPKNVYVQY